jgi:hydrogenase maturation protease
MMNATPVERGDRPDGEDGYTLILGIGNVLWADEGFGVRVAEVLNRDYALPDSVRLVDGGTQGIFLLPWVRSACSLLIFDAIDFGLPPGTLRVIRDDEVPCFMGAKKVSMHQAGFQEVLSSAALSGRYPSKLALVGVQPELLDDYGGSLTSTVKAEIPRAVEVGLAVLDEWGVHLTRRARPPSDTDLIGPGALDIASYELQRPSFRG